MSEWRDRWPSLADGVRAVLDHLESDAERDISRVIRKLREAWVLEMAYPEIAQINRGDCFDFAQLVVDFLGEGDTAWDRYEDDGGEGVGHCFIVYRGRLYDAEAPEGVRYWWQLPCEVRAEVKPRRRA